MNIALIAILIAVAIIALAGAVAFVLIVINIQAVDRSKRLMSEPRGLLDAATRRLLGGRGSGVRQTKRS